MTPRIRRLAASSRADLVVYLLSLVPMLPALGAGLVADDYLHRGVFLRLPVLGGGSPLLGLFRFATAGSGQLPLREIGVLPWVRRAFSSPVFPRSTSSRQRSSTKTAPSKSSALKGRSRRPWRGCNSW